MAKNPRWHRASVDLFTHFTLVRSEKAYLREMRRLAVPASEVPPWVKPGADATTYFVVHGDTGRHCAIVAIRGTEKHSGVQIAGLIVHEAAHVWQHCRDLMGNEKPSWEFEAYAIQGIAQDLMQLYADGEGA